MKILFVTRWYPSPSHRYAGVFVREHAKAVRAAGHEVAVLHLPGEPGDGRKPWQMIEETDATLTEGIPTYHVYCRAVSVPRLGRVSKLSTNWRYAWSGYRAARRIRARGFRPDVIHAHVFTTGLPAVSIARLFRRPLVITEHSTAFPRQTLGRGARRVAAFVFGRAARVLPVCAFLQRAIEAYGIKARFDIVPNAVDTALFFPADSAAAVPAGRKPRPARRLLFVGSLEEAHHKGFPELVEALAMLHRRRTDWRLEVAGDGPTRPDYERLVAATGLQDAVVFRGRMSKIDIAALMRASDLFVLPSRFENLPCVIIEAMASGLPVVSTTVGGIPEMVSDGDGILVPPQDPAALADALDRALSNLASFDRAAIAARARERFSLEAVGTQLQAVYEDVAARR
jgi:glycosyltransferase involved in cell wall biosynthesis